MIKATTQIQHGVDDSYTLFQEGDEIPTGLLLDRDIESLLAIGAITVEEEVAKAEPTPKAEVVTTEVTEEVK